MKKTLLILAIIYSGSTFCQIGKGTIFVGPGLSFSNSKSETIQENLPLYTQTNTNMNLNVNLRLGYFITDKVAAGIVGQHSTYKIVTEGKQVPDVNINTNKQGINYFGVFGRYYKMVNESKLGFFGQLDLMYGLGKITNTSENTNGVVTIKNEDKIDIKALRIAMAPGVVYFVSDRLAFETYFAGLSFNSETDKFSRNGVSLSETKSSNINLNFGISNFYFGLNFYLGRKKS